VHDATEQIRDMPDAWSPINNRLRKCNVGHFPYGVVYPHIEGAIDNIGVIHLHRGPNRWEEWIGRS